MSDTQTDFETTELDLEGVYVEEDDLFPSLGETIDSFLDSMDEETVECEPAFSGEFLRKIFLAADLLQGACEFLDGERRVLHRTSLPERERKRYDAENGTEVYIESVISPDPSFPLTRLKRAQRVLLSALQKDIQMIPTEEGVSAALDASGSTEHLEV